MPTTTAKRTLSAEPLLRRCEWGFRPAVALLQQAHGRHSPTAIRLTSSTSPWTARPTSLDATDRVTFRQASPPAANSRQRANGWLGEPAPLQWDSPTSTEP